MNHRGKRERESQREEGGYWHKSVMAAIKWVPSLVQVCGWRLSLKAKEKWAKGQWVITPWGWGTPYWPVFLIQQPATSQGDWGGHDGVITLKYIPVARKGHFPCSCLKFYFSKLQNCDIKGIHQCSWVSVGVIFSNGLPWIPVSWLPTRHSTLHAQLSDFLFRNYLSFLVQNLDWHVRQDTLPSGFSHCGALTWMQWPKAGREKQYHQVTTSPTPVQPAAVSRILSLCLPLQISFGFEWYCVLFSLSSLPALVILAF